jgi:hypothetical protein
MKSVLPFLGLLFFVVSNALCISPEETFRQFQEGKTIKFTVLGHAKSKGANFSIKYPQSWMAKEGERPNMVQNFVSDNGKGSEVANITTKALPPGEPFNEAYAKSALSPQALVSLVPKGGSLVRAISTTIDGELAGLAEYGIHQQAAGMEFDSYHMSVAFWQHHTLVIVSFVVFGTSAADAAQRFEAFRPLFTLMLTSIVFDGKWK